MTVRWGVVGVVLAIVWLAWVASCVTPSLEFR